jgi:hypothetical protein
MLDINHASPSKSADERRHGRSHNIGGATTRIAEQNQLRVGIVPADESDQGCHIGDPDPICLVTNDDRVIP